MLSYNLSTYMAFKILNISTQVRKISAWRLAHVLQNESQYPLASIAVGYLQGFFPLF